MYKCMNGLAPEYLTEFFKKWSSVNNYTLRSTSLDNLHVQKPNTNFGKRSFQYSGIILWNSLPLTLKECKNLELFKRHCSIYLLNKQETELL
jgi:hypothetical protein